MYIPEGVTPCRVHPDEWWHSRPGTRKTDKAVALCHVCPERAACLRATLKFEKERLGRAQPSVYGGLLEDERNTRIGFIKPAPLGADS